MHRKRTVWICIVFMVASVFVYSQETVRIKDIAYIQGVRENQLIGFGIVTGLAGKGDSDSSVLLKKILSNLLSGFGITIPPKDIKSKNSAAVMVTADIPPFIRPGDRIPVTLSSIGDAKSLEGGVLLQTNLKAANDKVYAVAQGKIAYTDLGKSVQTVGYIPGGAIVEREAVSSISDNNYVSIILYQSDFATAWEVAQEVQQVFPDTPVSAEDASMIRVEIPENFRGNHVGFIAGIENITVVPDTSAKVVINPRTGIVVMGKDVKIGKVAVSYKGDRISVGTGFGFGEEPKEQFVLEELTTVDQLVEVMQEIGMKTDAIIEVLKAIEKAGALYGRIIIM